MLLCYWTRKNTFISQEVNKNAVRLKLFQSIILRMPRLLELYPLIIIIPVSAIIIKVLSMGVRQDVFNIGQNYLPVPVPVPVATCICSKRYLKPRHCSFLKLINQMYTNKSSKFKRKIYIVSTKNNLATFVTTMVHAHSIFRMLHIFRIIIWNSKKNELICREVLLMEPFQYKAKGRKQQIL